MAVAREAVREENRNRRRRRTGAFGVFLLLFVVYQANLDFLPVSDALGTTGLAISILRDGDLTFTPEQDPALFEWSLETNGQSRRVTVHHMNQVIAGRTAREWYRAGRLRVAEVPYYLTRTTRDGVYANTFSIGAAVTALPVFAGARLGWGESFFHRTDLIWYAGKVAASLAVALSAAFVVLAAACFVPVRFAVGVALLYGLGTCVWSVASQALWQHGPNLLFLAIGAWAFLHSERRAKFAAAAGFALGMAVLCRPTSAIPVAVLGAYLCVSQRRACLPFLGSAALAGFALAWYNVALFGSPFASGQTEVSVAMAESLTGSPDLFGTPLWKGALGLLVSPSRGLFVYSPVAVVGVWGGVQAWRDPRFRLLRPLGIAVALTWLVAFKWYDWWGGWTFGYRPLVDTMGFLSLLAIPVVPRVPGSRVLRLPVLALATWSILVQGLGAFCYNGFGWNNRTRFDIAFPDGTTERTIDHDEAAEWVSRRGGEVVGVSKLDVCRREHLERLWSWSDSQLGYYLKYPGLARSDKQSFMAWWLRRYRDLPEDWEGGENRGGRGPP